MMSNHWSQTSFFAIYDAGQNGNLILHPQNLRLISSKSREKCHGDKGQNGTNVETKTTDYIQEKRCSDLQTEKKEIQKLSY